MPSYTLQCGHRFDLRDVVMRCITEKPGRNICPICKTPISSEECFYLAYCDTTKMTLEEFIRSEEERKAKRLTEQSNVSLKLLPNCSGICKNGKRCTKVSTRASGVFCNLHVI